MEKQAGGNRAGTGLLGPGRSAARTPRQLIEPARLAGSALLHTQSDARLVDLARAGNDRAFEAIVARYRRPLLGYCERLLPPGRAEDAVQQAFLNAYRAIGRNEAELNLRPWLYRVAHNASLNLLRQNGWNYDEIPEDSDGVVQPPQALEQRERIREVIRAVQDLPERQRDAIVLRELEGRSYEEIAGALGVTDGAVRQLLNRARTTLRAGATAVTPYGLAERIAMAASGNGGPVSERIAEICGAGAGGTGGSGGGRGSSGPGPSGPSMGGSVDGGGPGPSGTSVTSGDGSSGSSGPGPSGSGTSGSGTSGSSDGGISGTSGSRDG